MSKEGDKASVFKTTKVRTKLKGDNSWLQRSSQSQPKGDEEKPWIAEVKASRLNGANVETSPVSSPIQSSPSPLKTSTVRSPTSGFLIRGVFTKTEKTPTTSNVFNGTTTFTKKPSESYIKIAPHTVRNITENQESQLSQEEQEKRTKAASSVLKKSSTEKRSYVLSAAKIYETKDKTPDLLVNSPAFVAQRVETTDDEESNATSLTTATDVTPLPKPRISSTQIEFMEEVKVEEVKEKEKDPFENMVPGCTKVATPLPELIPDLVQVTYVKPDDSGEAEEPESPVVEETPPSPPSPAPRQTTVSTTVTIVTTEETEPEKSLLDISSDNNVVPAFYADTIPKRVEVVEPQPLVKVEPLKTPEVEAELELQPKVELNTETLLKPQAEPVLQTQINLKEEEPEQLVEDLKVQKEAETEIQTDDEPKQDPTQQSIVEQQSTNTIRYVEPLTDDLLAFNDSPKSVPLIPISFGSRGQDLLSPIESEKPEPVKPGTSLVDLLSNEDIVVTEEHSLSALPEEKKQTETQSVTETVTITTKTVIITDEREEESADPLSSHMITTVTESSSTDPFDPYPIGTTSSNSTSDLLKPLADISISSSSDTSVKTNAPSIETNMSGNLLDSLSDDITPFNTEAPRLSTHSWTRTWEPESTEESQEPAKAEESQAGDEQTVIMFERKSSENDSPWDRWTSPTVYTIQTNKDEDEEEESDMPDDSETQIISTVTTIRETYSEPEPSMDLTSAESDGESKKPFVYVKEYVNASELSLLNAKDTDSDYLTSSSTSYSYSSPSTYLSDSLSTKCTFCGEQVGSDAKITVEHLNINCHPECFKCGVCGIPMGDFLHKMFLHGGIVHCESCYRNA
ncbi:zinc finger protein 185 [Eucyclogobius newberryi]|uniref:zinc finger protein 185 n=1 Tax=Eucyclogobius newberryi TaxID=166745 RepID=UPI003B5A1722